MSKLTLSKSTTPTKLNTPVLFIVFNRPFTTAKVFDAIRKAKPPRLYVAADGPRETRPGEAELVFKVREMATAVDWPCEIKTLFHDNNFGCKYTVSKAIDWFFEHEEQGIILEDDCVPNQYFFTFCETLLEKYATDERVSVITGDNFQNGKQRGDGSYYFSKYIHVWGWASWRRAWQNYNLELSFWPEWKSSQDWRNKFPDYVERNYWENIFDQMYAQQIDTWDYSWLASVWYYGGLTITPNVNLVSNIGFGPDSTHTSSADSSLARMKTYKIHEFIHPTIIAQDREADKYNFDHAFGGKTQRLPRALVKKYLRLVQLYFQKVIKEFF